MTDADDVSWYERTEHCGKCGQPGDFCLCTDQDRCGCRALHRMGSGRDLDALSRFGTVDVDQGGLW